VNRGGETAKIALGLLKLTVPPQADRETARRYDGWFDERWGRYAWPVESQAVLRALGPVSGRRIADIGCGTARLATLLAADGASVVGIDLDAAMLAVAASRLRGRLVRAEPPRTRVLERTRRRAPLV
jgi:2-polyprenyl-3-methyl-5-hydroxy-6-metoxy-1,4-benzoquinol methylase